LRTIREIPGGPKRVALITIVATLTLAWFFPRGRVRANPPPDASDPNAAIAVFRGDTLDDLARLLRPLMMSSTASSGAKITLYLRDAVYAGAVNGEARLITLWLTADTNDSTAVLTHSDTANPLATIADRLAQGSLSGSAFVLIPAKVGWQDWTMSVSPAGDAVVRAPSGGADIQSAVSNATSALPACGHPLGDHSYRV